MAVARPWPGVGVMLLLLLERLGWGRRRISLVRDTGKVRDMNTTYTMDGGKEKRAQQLRPPTRRKKTTCRAVLARDNQRWRMNNGRDHPERTYYAYIVHCRRVEVYA